MKLIFSFSDPVNFPDPRSALRSLFPHRLASSRFRRGRNTFRSITHFYHLKRFFVRTLPPGPVGPAADGHDLDKYNPSANRGAMASEAIAAGKRAVTDSSLYSHSLRRRLRPRYTCLSSRR